MESGTIPRPQFTGFVYVARKPGCGCVVAGAAELAEETKPDEPIHYDLARELGEWVIRGDKVEKLWLPGKGVTVTGCNCNDEPKLDDGARTRVSEEE